MPVVVVVSLTYRIRLFHRQTEEDAEHLLQSTPARRNLTKHSKLRRALQEAFAVLHNHDPSRGFFAAVSFKSPVEESAIDRGVILARNGLGVAESDAEEMLREHLRGSTQGPSRFQRILAAPRNRSRLPYNLWDVYNAFPLSLRRALGPVVTIDAHPKHKPTGKPDYTKKNLMGRVGDLLEALVQRLPDAIEVTTEPLVPVLRLNPGSNTYRNRRNRLASPQAASPRRTHVTTLVIYLGIVHVLSLPCHYYTYP